MFLGEIDFGGTFTVPFLYLGLRISVEWKRPISLRVDVRVVRVEILIF